jgi:sensor c-di-GMP phosphodiesterase-like protein
MQARKGKLANAQILLNLLWGLFSLVLLLIVFYFVGQKERLQTQQSLILAADEVADKIDNLVVGILQSIYAVLDTNFKDCNAKLVSSFQHIVFNNPNVSAIIIKDKNNTTMCGTLTHGTSSIISSNQNLILYGPIQFSAKDKPTFILQQRVGDKYLQVFILKEVLEKALVPTSRIAQWVGLYNIPQQKVVLQILRDFTNHEWKSDTANLQEVLHQPEAASLLKMNLNLNNFQVILLGDAKIIRKYSLYYELVALSFLVLIALAMYYYLQRAIHKHFSLHRALEIGIKNNDFFPMYQPIFNINTKTFCGAEILLRWRTDDQDIIMPDLFISDAEESGLILPITLQLIEKTFQESKSILNKYPDFHLAFNVSAVHFVKEEFLTLFYALCKKYQIPADNLMLEITERDLLHQEEATIAQRIQELRAADFSVAVDDFGTGHASISYLQHFAFNYLKIDQLFVGAIGTGAITETLNKSIIQMAKNLQLNIIAEGVESFEQQEFLKEHGVNLMQGWYYAKAMSIEELIQFMQGVHHEQKG